MNFAFCINFANFCMNNNANPVLVAKAIKLLRKAKTAYNNSNLVGYPPGEEEKHDRLTAKVEKLLLEMGFTDISWPGLAPTFKRDGRSEMLPS